MKLTLDPASDAATAEAVRASVAAAHDLSASAAQHASSAWWQAGVAEAVERSAGRSPRRAPGYDAARSPRSTRGATRA